MHAVHDDTGSVLFAAAESEHHGLCALGLGCDLAPGHWSIYGDLDETRKPTYAISTLIYSLKASMKTRALDGSCPIQGS